MSDLSAVRFTWRLCGKVRLHVAEAGPADGPLVILLHGFPEFWFGWRHQIGPLAAAGFHVVAPDQRGYNLSDKPKGIAAYDLDCLADDVLALAKHYTDGPFRLVGHDWGAVAAWWTLTRAPSSVLKFAALNCPHPAVWRETMRSEPAQRRASWYVAAFQIPWLPEALMRAGDFRALTGALREAHVPPTEGEIARYRDAWSQPGALTAMVNWYRAIFRRSFAPPSAGSIEPPVRIIWGRQDRYALPALAEASLKLCANGHLAFLDGATHWVAQDEADRVNEMLIGFLGPVSA